VSDTELAWLEQGSRVALEVLRTDEPTHSRMVHYYVWRFGARAMLAEWARRALK